MPLAWERTNCGRPDARMWIWLVPSVGGALGILERVGALPQAETVRARIVADEEDIAAYGQFTVLSKVHKMDSRMMLIETDVCWGLAA